MSTVRQLYQPELRGISVDAFHPRDEVAVVEKEIQSHTHQIEALSKRLEGLKRADELFESDQAAIAELLQASIGNGSGITRQMATTPAVTTQTAAREGHGCAKTTRARHSNWPRQHEARTSQSSRSHDEPQRRAHPGRHDGRGSQAPSAPDRPRINRATRQGISLEDQRERSHWQAVHAAR